MFMRLFSDDAPPFAIGGLHLGAQSPSSPSSPQFPVPRVVNVKDEWTPVSHGDPLRDDATLYYAPPSLERVRITSRHEQTTFITVWGWRQCLPTVLENVSSVF